MSKKDVPCVPGGHRVPLDIKVYWCPQCEHYMCRDHVRTSLWASAVKCPNAHLAQKVIRT